jgi:rubrerythrin
MRYAFARSGISAEALCEILTRLWQIKMRSIDLLDRWHETARDADVRAGIGAQISDERRHLRLLADELKRRSGRQPSTVDHVVTKAFALVQAQPTDMLKVCAYYRGIKTATNQRFYKLLAYADLELLEVLERVLHDDERTLRWADIRLRSLSAEDVRRCNALLLRMGDTMEAVWSRPWRHLSSSKLAYLG